MTNIRLDTVTIPKTYLTEEGYLRGDAVVTRTGIFTYRNFDGTIRKELRHPDEVFKKESLETLKLIPITIEHPSTVFVDAATAKVTAVGNVGETINIDSEEVIAKINIICKEGVDVVKRGKKELSLGYTSDTIEEGGVWEGETYTHKQTNIRYNHLAIVDRGRAGRSARINHDNALIEIKEDYVMELEDYKKMSIKLDVLEKEVAKKEDSTKEIQVKLDKAEALIDELKKENEGLKTQRLDSVINAKVKERIQLINKASKVINLDDALLAKSDREIQEYVIKSKDATVDLSIKTDAYVEGRFDAIVDNFKTNEMTFATQMRKLDSVVANVESITVSPFKIMNEVFLKAGRK